MHKIKLRQGAWLRKMGLSLVIAAFAVGLVAQSAFAAVTLEGMQVQKPMEEYIGQAGTYLIAIVVSGFAAMALIALGMAGWRGGKRLIGKLF